MSVDKNCTRCNLRPFVYGSEKDGMCEVCFAIKKAEIGRRNAQQPSVARLANNPNLSDRQRATLKKRAPKRNMVEEEDEQPGLCLGGCGKTVTGPRCQECNEELDRQNYGLRPGEIELFRGTVGDPKDRIVKQVVMRKATSIKPRAQEWLWQDRIPKGAITWIVGQPGNAKSLLTIEVCAAATTGKNWPDGSENKNGPMKVLMFCGEDDLATTVIPRLMAAGANLENVGFLDNKSFRGTVGESKVPGRSIDLSQDLETLMQMIKENSDFKLLIADPITGIFGSKKITKDEEVNPILEELVDLCQQTGPTFVGISHTPKRQTNSAIEKISGGSAVAGKCRAAFMLSQDPDSDGDHDHVMTIIKGNLTGNKKGMKYTTVSATVLDENGKEIPIVKISWSTEECDMTADDVLVKQNSRKGEDDRQIVRCEAFLRTYLADGPVRSPDVYDAAKMQEFGKSTVKRALKNIGGDHIDRRNQHEGYWMTLTPGAPFPADVVKPEQVSMALAAGEEL
jgi:putative DNA primase/helicase